jgi:hypothetical protein
LALSAAATPCGGQAIRVRATERGTGRVAVGALASLRDSTGRTLIQGLTDQRGVIILAAPSPGRFTLRIDRIGYAGLTLGPIGLVSRDTASIDAVVPDVRVGLPELTVQSTNPVECELQASAGAVVSMLWDEARKALASSEAPQSRLHPLEIARYDRRFGPDGSIVEESSRRHKGETPAPFIAVAPARLARNGFHQRRGSNHIFHAPDARVLLSDEFLAQHCFAPAPGPVGSGLVGLRFAPTRRHRNRVDVTGTLWLDQRTAELRHLEFVHTNVDRRLRSGAENGLIEFARLPSGEWIVARWRLRVGYAERGGEVALVGSDGQAPMAGGWVAGVVYDSLAGRPLADAVISVGPTFRTGSDGAYRLAIPVGREVVVTARHPRLELFDLVPSARAAAVIRGQEIRLDFAVPSRQTLIARSCPDRSVRIETEAVIVGRTVDSTGQRRSGEIEATWTGTPLLRATRRATIGDRETRMTVPADSLGRFAICGVPAGIEIRLALPGRADSARARATARAGELVLLDPA